jgi:hypothetical protein
MTAAAFYNDGPKVPVHGKDMRRFDLITVLADRMPKIRNNIDQLDINLASISSRKELRKAVDKTLGPAYKAMKEYERATNRDDVQVIRAYIDLEQKSLDDHVTIERPFMPSETDKMGYTRFDPNDKELTEEYTSYLDNLEHVKQFMGEPFISFVNIFPPDYSLVKEIVSRIIVADKKFGGIYK